MKKLISLAICFVILLSITACDNHNDSMDFSKNPVSPTVLPHELFLSPHTGSTIRASQYLIGSGSLQTSATLTLQGWIAHWAVPPERIIDGLWDSSFTFAPYGNQPGEVILTWSHPQSISLIQIYAAGLWSYWNIDVAYKFSSEEVLWQSLPTNWENSMLYPPETWGVLLSSNFPAISATVIRISIRNVNSPYPHLSLAEIGIFGPPTPLKIISPSEGSQFMAGDDIHFTSSSSVSLTNYQWFADGVVFGATPGSPNNSANYLAPGTHTIRLTATNPADSSILEDSISIFVLDVAAIKIKNLSAQDNEDPYAELTDASYRRGKTTFQAIGCNMNGDELGPVSVRWELEGGDIDAHDQLKMGILSQLGQLNTKIGNLDNSLAVVASNSTVTFNSFLPGNITIKASKGNLTDSVNVRIKHPHFKVNVYPVGDVDTSIFNTWKDIALQIWEKENIIKVDSIDLMPAIANVSYPNAPFGQPMRGAESFLSSELYVELDLTHPLVYDCLLGDTSGFFNVPRQTGLLMENGEASPVNVFMVKDSFSYYVSDPFTNPPEKQWREPYIYSISSLDHFVTLENSCATIKTPTTPYFDRHKRYLAAGIGRNFGLPQYANWLNNFMDFSDNGALDVTPLQYIAALNYNNDNPQNSVKFREE